VRRYAPLGIALILAAGTLAPVASAQQASGKTLVMGFSQEPDTFIAGEGNEYVTQVASNLVYEQQGLVGIDDQMRPYPMFVTEVPTLDNGGAVMVGDGADQHLETTFHLRQDAKFSDGTPLSSDDVIFSWKMSLNPLWSASAGNDAESKYTEVVAKDPHTVVFKMMSQNQARAAGLAGQVGPVVSPLYYEGLPDVQIYPSKRLGPLVDFDPQNSPKMKDLLTSVYTRQPIGLGPYTLDAWDPGVQMTFKARSDYFRGKPPIDTIIIRGFEASKETLLSQLQAGDIQTIGSETLDVSDVDAVNAISGVKSYIRAGTTIEHIDVNTQDPILQDKQIRKAMLFAINRQDLVNRALAAQGQQLVANSLVPPISQLFNPDTPNYNYNPDQAKAILDAAGWTVGSDGIRVNSSGQRLSFKYQSTGSALRKKVMPLVKDNLAAVGIDVQIDQLPAQAYFGINGPLRSGSLQMAEYADVGSNDAGQDAVQKYASKNIPTSANSFAGSNYSRWNNSTADTLLNAQINSLVPSVRGGAMSSLQLLMSDELPTLPLFFRPNVTAASTHLVNFKPEYASNGYNWNVWEWDLR
jgi:peptide/nickel transport system substrate-binding protein